MRGVRIDPSGYDAGKKIKGKKRHILVDTLGLRIPTKPAGHSNRKPATNSDLKPAGVPI